MHACAGVGSVGGVGRLCFRHKISRGDTSVAGRVPPRGGPPGGGGVRARRALLARTASPCPVVGQFGVGSAFVAGGNPAKSPAV